MDACVRLRFVAAIACGTGVLACDERTRPSPDVPNDQATVRTAATPTCGLTPGSRLTGDGVGALRVGVSVDSVRAECVVLADTVLEGPEGMLQRTLRVDLTRDTLVAVVQDARVWRVHVTGSAFRTTDSLGVGSTARDLVTRPGVRVMQGEGRTFLMADAPCGLSFALARPVHVRRASQVPDSLRVAEVLAVGCSTVGR